jgi:hypothetical protein
MADPHQPIRLPWFEAEDYAQFKSFIGADILPESHAQWLAAAEAIERQILREGKTVLRVSVDLWDFRDWCHWTSVRADEKALAEYVRWYAGRPLDHTAAA